MKKQLLTLAAGVAALGAMAAAPQVSTLGVAKAQLPACEFQLAPKTAAQAPASRAGWQDFGLCNFRTPVAHNMYPSYPAEWKDLKIESQEGENGVMNYRVYGLFGLDMVEFYTQPIQVQVQDQTGATKTVEFDAVRVPEQKCGLSTQNYGDVMMADAGTWCSLAVKNGNSFGLTQEDVDYYMTKSYFDETEGKFCIDMAYYVNKGNGKDSYGTFGMGMENCKLQGAGWKTYEINIENPWFRKNAEGEAFLAFTINLNDCQYATAYAIQYEPKSGNQAELDELNKNLNALFDGSVELTTIEENGEAQVPLAKLTNGKPYTLFISWVNANGDMVTDPMGYITGYEYHTYTYDAPQVGWEAMGWGEYTDCFLTSALTTLNLQYSDGTPVLALDAFGFTNGYTAKVQVEKSTETQGMYKLVKPFSTAAADMTAMAQFVTYDEGADEMIINATNPECVYIENGTTGVAFNTQDAGIMQIDYASVGYDCEMNDAPIDPAMCGAIVDGVLTFPEPNPDTLNEGPWPLSMICGEGMGAAGMNFSSGVYQFPFRLVLPGYVGINDTMVGNDSNAPVEYYNLQGIRVAEPQHGVYIKRQGNKVTKILK